MTELAIQCRGVRKTYPHFTLHDIDLDVPEGSIMGFIGPNGAGKSTTIRILMGLVRQEQGEVNVLGKSMPEQQIAAKRDIGFVSEDMRLYRGQSIRFHMDFVASVFSSWDEAYANELLERFGLIAEQQVKGLSHGQRVKASLLLVLARRPKLLVFDEPTTGLDPMARHEVTQEMMLVLADETRTILFSSHNTLDVEQISDHITFIQHGNIIDSGDKESFIEKWRRVRIETPDGFRIPQMAGLVEFQQSGHLAAITTDQFCDAFTGKLQASGARITGLDRLTLEEIFLASVKQKGAIQ